MLEHPGALHLLPVLADCEVVPVVVAVVAVFVVVVASALCGNGVRALDVVHPRRSQWSQCSRISLRIMRMFVPAVVRHSWYSSLSSYGPSPLHMFILMRSRMASGCTAFSMIEHRICWGGFCRAYMVRVAFFHLLM